MARAVLGFTIAFAGTAFAQSLSFGVKAGVPLTDAFATANRPPLSYSSVTRRYTVGPTADIGLPLLGLQVEADALYHRIGWDSSRTATPLFEPFVSTVRIGAWDFDALLKRRFGGVGVHPYLGAGAAFRRFFTTRQIYSFSGRSLSKQKVDEIRDKNIAGLVFSAGIEFGGAVRLAPEFRFTRWLMNNIPDAFPIHTQANQAEVLLSLTFGRH